MGCIRKDQHVGYVCVCVCVCVCAGRHSHSCVEGVLICHAKHGFVVKINVLACVCAYGTLWRVQLSLVQGSVELQDMEQEELDITRQSLDFIPIYTLHMVKIEPSNVYLDTLDACKILNLEFKMMERSLTVLENSLLCLILGREN